MVSRFTLEDDFFVKGFSERFLEHGARVCVEWYKKFPAQMDAILKYFVGGEPYPLEYMHAREGPQGRRYRHGKLTFSGRRVSESTSLLLI